MTGRQARNYKIGVIPGDGVGPEVIAEGLKVLEDVSRKDGFTYELTYYPYSAQHYLDTGETMPKAILEEYRTLDAIYLGALGDPRLEPGFIEKPVIMGLRFGLDLYINLRPIKLYAEQFCPLKGKTPADVDLVVVRENTEDAYTGIGGIFKEGTADEVAIAEMVFTRKGAERAIRYAFDLARRRNKKKKVTMVDKANAIRPMDLWTRTFAEVGEEYPDIEKEHAYIDAACMWMVKNPEWFDVVVTSNLFGDIITDIGAMIQGGLGVAASGNIHPGQISMFEPIHGSAPKYAGKGVVNPMAAIAAAGMLLDYVGERGSAARIESALQAALTSGKIQSLGADSGLSTSRVGELVREALG
ncbi:Isocitrate/isopropylmalate dehydrogenase, conserved site [Acididesulfobacillus acetoxydans]|uniref:3-isopropylmalate dehydrogenase n=1 Tax=Acididesulfobacillus acetoxydans TaxID=1561005 RepID=A0A8S0VWR0_9FIRM|nr:3-isopropylmalate dehydrogenase [Acididesulfobacillus acetoxydans]CAA7601133.1 Isocitrate/isopropylmalate dehydrogenase, conserved site [Acididesulfobacillus acetoxydans]CEJ08588.1 3-isopropylmalate dehydrogenase [Acididesulfobacillus acetoxydans]